MRQVFWREYRQHFLWILKVYAESWISIEKVWLNIQIPIFKIFISSSWFLWGDTSIMDLIPLCYGCDTSDMHIVWWSTSQSNFNHNIFIVIWNGSECQFWHWENNLKWFWLFSRCPPNSIDSNSNGTNKSTFKHFPVVSLHFIRFQNGHNHKIVWDIIRLIGK